MCDTGACRPCRAEERAMNRAMGVIREYVEPKPPSREENYTNRKVASLSMRTSSKRMCSGTTSAAQRKSDYDSYKEQRDLINGRMVSRVAPSHGTTTGYKKYSCRCLLCSFAYSQYKKDENAKKRQVPERV